MKKPAHFHCLQSFLQTLLPELGAVAGIKSSQPGAAGHCLLPTATQLLQPLSAMLCHEGQQDTQAVPAGHFSAM